MFVHFDEIFNLTFGQNCHFNQMYLSNVTCFLCFKPLVKMDIPFGQYEHFDQVSFLKSCDFLWCKLNR
jgi:hypothetical protein